MVAKWLQSILSSWIQYNAPHISDSKLREKEAAKHHLNSMEATLSA
jgi:hypothetical protein